MKVQVVECYLGAAALPMYLALLGCSEGCRTAPGRTLDLGPGCHLALHNDETVLGSLTLDFAYASSQAVGKGTSHAEWFLAEPAFRLGSVPITLVQTALTFPGRAELPVRARVSALVQPPHYAVPARLETPWLSTVCQVAESPR